MLVAAVFATARPIETWDQSAPRQASKAYEDSSSAGFLPYRRSREPGMAMGSGAIRESLSPQFGLLESSRAIIRENYSSWRMHQLKGARTL